LGEIVKDRDELVRKLGARGGTTLLAERGGAVVLADGAFDLIHPGHVSFLEAARQQGGVLVVALHTDDVVASNKGPGRPLNPWADRARVLAALASVDFVFAQDDRHLDELVRAFRPAVLAKGTDVAASSVRERKLVESLGGKVVICGDPKSHSVARVAGRAEPTAFKSAWEGARDVPAQPGKLSIIVLTKNEEANVRACLESAAWADELIVCDSYSTDRTAEIAREYTPNVVQHEYVHYGAQQNWIIPQASSEWVMILDADEVISPELQRAIRDTMRLGDQCDGFRVVRRTYFLGRVIDHCGWGMDYTNRLFRRDKGRYQDKQVHANVEIEGGRIGTIDEPLIHYTDRDLRNYFEKFDRYSSMRAADMFRKGERFRIWKLLLKPPARFFRMYVLKLGFLDGFHGLLLCGLSSMTMFARYAKLWEMERRGGVGQLPSGRR
jgi:rfaE bifunctional protein nucleotidyltransferase chain/domain